MIRGHKHLQECAYIGDDSSEELDELMEAIREGTYVGNESIRSIVNQPDLMKRHREDVEFHHPAHQNTTKNHTINKSIDSSDITDPIIMKKILDSLQEKNKKKNKEDIYMTYIPRNSTIGRGEDVNFNIFAPDVHQTPKSKSQETYEDIVKKLQSLGERSGDILKKVNEDFQLNMIPKNKSLDKDHVKEQKMNMKGRHYSKPLVQFDDIIDKARRRRDITLSNSLDSELNRDDDESNVAMEEVRILFISCSYNVLETYSMA